MKVRDVLVESREAAIELRNLEEEALLRRETVGVQGHTYSQHSKSGILDPMRKLVDLLDWEGSLPDFGVLMDCVSEAAVLVDGASTMVDELGSEVLRRYYVEGEPLASIVNDLTIDSFHGLTRRDRERVLKAAIDATVAELESMGCARLRSIGQAMENC